MGTINNPPYYNVGYPEVIDIISGWGMEADFCAGNVLKYFLRAPYKGQEESDYRKAMWYLDRMYRRDIGMFCDILCHDRIMSSPIRLRHSKINLNWFEVLDYDKEITLHKVVNGWGLEDERKDFIVNFYYQNFNIEKCIKILAKIIDDISEPEEEEDDL